MTTTTVSVKISEEEKRQLKKYGRPSDVLREGMKLFLSKKKTEELLGRLEKLRAENVIKTIIEEEVRLVRVDRNR